MYSAVKIIILQIFLNHYVCEHFNNITIKIIRGEKEIDIEFADEIINKSEVTDVIIEWQDVTTLKSGAFHDLPELKIVKIRNCNLSNIESGVFNNVPKLQVINLNLNKLRHIPGGALNHLNLTHLYLTGNSIQEIDTGAFDYLSYLQVLDLSNNVIENLPRINFYKTTNLIKINLSFNKITYIPDYFFYHCMSNVVMNQGSVIDLSHNYITYLGNKFLEGVYIIDKLLLNNNLIEELAPKIFHKIQHIKTVDLEGNSLKYLNIENLNHLTHSTEIKLSANPWNCTFVRKYTLWCVNNNKSNSIDKEILDECNYKNK